MRNECHDSFLRLKFSKTKESDGNTHYYNNGTLFTSCYQLIQLFSGLFVGYYLLIEETLVFNLLPNFVLGNILSTVFYSSFYVHLSDWL